MKKPDETALERAFLNALKEYENAKHIGKAKGSSGNCLSREGGKASRKLLARRLKEYVRKHDGKAVEGIRQVGEEAEGEGQAEKAEE